MTEHRNARLAGVRSWLYTPGTRPDRFGRAAAAGADGLIVDLEDAVAPADKAAARAAACAFLDTGPAVGIVRAVRINPPATRDGLRDLDALLGIAGQADALVLPKCESAGEIGMVAALLAEARSATTIIAMAETAVGIARLPELAAAPALAGLAFGAADLSADLGGASDWAALAGIRSALVVHAAAAGIPAIDSPWFALDDADGLRAEARAAAALGFTAKAAVHPRQIPAITAAFTPSPEDVDWAGRVLAAARGGASRLDGAMIDRALVRRARRILMAAGRDVPGSPTHTAP